MGCSWSPQDRQGCKERWGLDLWQSTLSVRDSPLSETCDPRDERNERECTLKTCQAIDPTNLYQWLMKGCLRGYQLPCSAHDEVNVTCIYRQSANKTLHLWGWVNNNESLLGTKVVESFVKESKHICVVGRSDQVIC